MVNVLSVSPVTTGGGLNRYKGETSPSQFGDCEFLQMSTCPVLEVFDVFYIASLFFGDFLYTPSVFSGSLNLEWCSRGWGHGFVTLPRVRR